MKALPLPLLIRLRTFVKLTRRILRRRDPVVAAALGYGRPQPLYRRIVNLRVTFFTAGILSVLYFLGVALCAGPIYRHHSSWWTTQAECYFPYPAAVVNRTVIPLTRLRWETAVRSHYNTVNSLTGSVSDTERFVLDQVTNRALYQDALLKGGVRITDADVDREIESLYQTAQGEDTFRGYLSTQYGPKMTTERFRTWIREALAEAAVQRQLLVHITLRHLVIGVPEGATEAQIEDARLRTVAVRTSISDPSQFATSVAEHSEDVASRENGGMIGTTVRGAGEPDYVTAEFETAIFALPVGAVSDPIRSPKGWHLVLVEKREGTVEKSLADFTSELRTAAQINYFL